MALLKVEIRPNIKYYNIQAITMVYIRDVQTPGAR